MSAVLIRAARTARKASSGERVVDVTLTESGFVIRGRDVVRGREIKSAAELSWPEFDARPDMLVNSVVLVDRELARLERQA